MRDKIPQLLEFRIFYQAKRREVSAKGSQGPGARLPQGPLLQTLLETREGESRPGSREEPKGSSAGYSAEQPLRHLRQAGQTTGLSGYLEVIWRYG